MVNNKDFTERIKKILEHHQLTASLFADKIGVQRSSISHILSGRNKPSLDFILKITSEFPEVDIYWLLNGKGVFPKIVEETSNNTSPLPLVDKNKVVHSESGSRRITKIVVFYEDGTFEEFNK
ncbi:helix-turn-helix transcriptional regulator [Flavobacteriaceae bacterium S356]|uniref:Helix-turn-helix transcriptional regulator n=1 Tax=Asprobacillus argus TaxID=3076534 RepID=A0ABU3LDS2_9FLAO|nr:helix-turn-helix transcriptional regulator [Flavobacteriaceae bacterium S356]